MARPALPFSRVARPFTATHVLTHVPLRAARRSPIATSAAAVEFVPYVLVEKRGGYDLRLIQPHPVVVTAYARRDEGFERLGSYMSGANAAQCRCIETQPIVMTYPPDGPKTMQVYVVAREGQLDADAPLPLPDDPSAVRLDAAGGQLVAAMRFEGNATQEACEATLKALRQALSRDGLPLAAAEAAGTFRLAQYGPLHSLSTRINEIWLGVAV